MHTFLWPQTPTMILGAYRLSLCTVVLKRPQTYWHHLNLHGSDCSKDHSHSYEDIPPWITMHSREKNLHIKKMEVPAGLSTSSGTSWEVGEKQTEGERQNHHDKFRKKLFEVSRNRQKFSWNSWRREIEGKKHKKKSTTMRQVWGCCSLQHTCLN